MGYRSAVLVPLVLLAGCSKPEPKSEVMVAPADTMEARDRSTFEVGRSSAPPAPADAVSAPGISVSSAPGVAFNYRYAFRLANAKISAVQEQHAQACEQLGLVRCRITGMRYRLGQDDLVEAMLAFKLDPAIARGFGKAAGEAVARAAGKTIDIEISGTDVATTITRARRDRATANDDLARIEAQLRQTNLDNPTRERLIAQAAELRARIRRANDMQEDGEQSLATTPMVFNFVSDAVVPGVEIATPIRDALHDAGSSIVRGIAIIIVLFAALLPWALAIGAIYALFRWLRPKWSRKVADYVATGPDRDAPMEG